MTCNVAGGEMPGYIVFGRETGKIGRPPSATKKQGGNA
jgi:hypothetical protein